MHNTQDPTADPLGASTRISLFHRSGQSWSQYINTLPPFLRRHYCTTPPLKHDYPPQQVLHEQLITTDCTEGYNINAIPPPPSTNSRKRHRTTPPTSDSDPEGYSRNNQPHEPPDPTPARIPQKPSTKAQSSSSAEETTHNRSASTNLPHTSLQKTPP